MTRKAYNKAYYRANKKKWRKYHAEWQRKHRDEVTGRVKRLAGKKKLLVLAAKNVPCTDCGNRFRPECMDFDHVRGTKSWNVSAMVERSFSVETILKEIAKCEVVCANCHRTRTVERKLRAVRT